MRKLLLVVAVICMMLVGCGAPSEEDMKEQSCVDEVQPYVTVERDEKLVEELANADFEIISDTIGPAYDYMYLTPYMQEIVTKVGNAKSVDEFASLVGDPNLDYTFFKVVSVENFDDFDDNKVDSIIRLDDGKELQVSYKIGKESSDSKEIDGRMFFSMKIESTNIGRSIFGSVDNFMTFMKTVYPDAEVKTTADGRVSEEKGNIAYKYTAKIKDNVYVKANIKYDLNHEFDQDSFTVVVYDIVTK